MLNACSRAPKKLDGAYATESSTGSYVMYEFGDDQSVICTSYMLGVKVAQEEGTYEIKDGNIIFYYEDGTKTFPLERDGDGIIINGNTYYPSSSY